MSEIGIFRVFASPGPSFTNWTFWRGMLILSRKVIRPLFRLKRSIASCGVVDFTFIEDCVQAHLCASRALDNNDAASGHAYFISQGEPVPLWIWINEVLSRNKLPHVKRSVPTWLALGLAGILEAFASAEKEPRFTRFLVKEMATSHYFDISAAERYLGYKPKISIDRALDLTFGPRNPEPPMAA